MKRVFLLAAVLVPLFGGWILLPLSQELSGTSAEPPTRILDRNGELLYEARHPEYGSQQWTALADIPQSIITALIATEDRSFYWHPGVSARGVLRAVWQNVTSGRVISGGSTITMQVVRHRLQPERRTFLYKIKEALYALKFDWHHSKDEILEEYLNTAFFGQQAYGIAAASQTFFGKNMDELSVAESALLIGLLQSPSAFNPFEHPGAAQERQKRVLAAMQDTSTISTEEYERAVEESLTFSHGRVEIEAPHFVMWILQSLRSSSLVPGPLDNCRETTGRATCDITTTLDLTLQKEIERIMDRNLEKLADKNVTSAAVVVLDAHKGDVLAMVGSADYFDEEHDGAVNVALSPRQPGSTLKPFTYALAFQDGATAASTVIDAEAQFLTQDGNPYVPRNYDFEYHGLVRYREALANSYNIAAVKVLEHVGVERLLSFLKQAGISTLKAPPEHYGLALTLGDGEVRLLELAQAYGIFARGGTTLNIRTLSDDPVEKGIQILDPGIAWLISDILSDNEARMPEFGPDSALAFERPVAAKTGTTRNARDNWVIGYSPDSIVGVWVGNTDNSPMLGTSGVTGAGPIFHDVMDAVHRNEPFKEFARPTTVLTRQVCRLSGKLPGLCPHLITESFLPGTEPTEEDDLYQMMRIDTRNGLRASQDCPDEFVREELMVVFPPELEKWSRKMAGQWCRVRIPPIAVMHHQQLRKDLC